MAEAIIFDIDGTLLDSVDLHAEAWQEAFRHFGREIPRGEIRSQIGKGGDQLLPVFLSKDELKAYGKELEEFRGRLFKEKYLPKVKPFPGVRELFLKVKENGQKVALASSAKADELKEFERIARIEDLVEVETSSADAKKSKPHPDIFQAALGRLSDHIRREEVVVVGDSPHDAEANCGGSVRWFSGSGPMEGRLYCYLSWAGGSAAALRRISLAEERVIAREIARSCCSPWYRKP